ncbi:MAG: NUDIX domain-containing protein [Patescibacteria group bacterium]
MPHIHDKIDFDSDVYIVNGDAVLLRMHDKHHIWLPPGGHVELDEDPEEAAYREVKEEVGLDVELVGEKPREFLPGDREIVRPRFMARHFVNETHEHVSCVYFAYSKTRDVVEGVEEEKSPDIRWFTKVALEDPALDILARVRHYALTALDELTGNAQSAI